jgi:hypothetical protein
MTSSKGEGMDGWTGDADLRNEPDRHIIQAERDASLKTGDLVTFSPRAGESAEGIITRVWDKPASDPYVTLRTTEDEGRTFTRCSSVVVRI